MRQEKKFSMAILVGLISTSTGGIRVAGGVERNVPSRYATIQAAIDAAVDGDEVIIAPGTYTGAGNRDIDFKGKAITVRSTNPEDPTVVAATIIDCQGTAASPHRGFVFQRGESSVYCILAGVTIRNGFHSNIGGGIYIRESSPTILCCRILGNTADGYGGGGISCDRSAARIRHCLIADNSTGYSSSGGGIVVASGPGVTIDSCVIVANSAWYGGGISCQSSDSTLIANSIVAQNRALYRGGGIFCLGGATAIAGCTVAKNCGDDSGGGLACTSGDAIVHLTNTILWNDIAMGGNGPEASVHDGSALTVDHCDVQGGQAGVFVGPQGVLQWGTGNIAADPTFLDPDGPDNEPATWQDNDYHLWAASPCVDRGGNDDVPVGVGADIDGDARILDGNGDGTSNVDIGADEYAGPPSQHVPADFNGDGGVDLGDFATFQRCFNGANQPLPFDECADADFDGDADVDLMDFAVFQGCFNGPNRPPACQ